MATFSRVSLAEARTSVLPPRRAMQERYRQYVRQLTPDAAGRLELGEEDRSITERARLKSAAKTEGITLDIHRRGNTMVFWVSNEPPKTRAKASTSGRGRAKRK
jgi:hypothetical protein